MKTCKQVNRKIFTGKKIIFPNVSSCNKSIDRKNLFVAKNSSFVGMFVFLRWKSIKNIIELSLAGYRTIFLFAVFCKIGALERWNVTLTDFMYN